MNVRLGTARTILVGPVLDADGVAKTNLAVAAILASKNGGNPGALDGAATLTHKQTGHYLLALTTSDISALGCLEISIDSTTDAMPIVRLNVLTAAGWDALHAASGGYVPSNMQYILGHLLTQTGTQVADGFQHYFDHATPAITVGDAMVGTAGANTTVPDAAGVVATALGILETHGDSTWSTATGFSTHSAADVYTAFGTGTNLTALVTATGFSTHSAADVYTAFGTGTNLTALVTATGFNTVTPDAAGVVATALGNLETHGDSTWATATGFNTVTPPTVAQFNARTIVSADYFVVGDYTAPDNTGIGNIETIVGHVTYGNAAILTQGNSAWITAVGFATPTNVTDAHATTDGLIGDVPTVAEFEARTVVSGDYFLVSDYTAPDNTGISNIETIVGHVTYGNAAILTQGNSAWATATGFNTVVPDIAGTAATLLGSLETHGDSAWATATGFNTVVPPSVAEFELRTLLSGGYLTAAEVNAEVKDVFTIDTSTLPTQGAPTATPTMEECLTYLYKNWRNKGTQTSSEHKVFADDGVTADHKATVADDGTTFTKGEMGTGA